MANAPKDKIEHNRRYLQYEFGNRPLAWPNLDELFNSGYDGKVSIRNMVPRGGFVSHFPVAELKKGKWPAPFPIPNARFNQSMPDEFLTLQGNIRPCITPGGIWLEYSTIPNETHREFTENLTADRQVGGFEALGRLKIHLWPGDYDWIMHLVETYQDAEAIEFSAYSRAVGNLPNSNCVIWELRNF
jgi:hypothetical protein